MQLVPKYSAALLAGRKVSALLSVSAEQNYALFYLDNLRFCDNEGMCNYTCPKVYPEGFIPGEEVDDFVQIQINNEGDFIVPDQEELTGTVKNTEDYTISISIEARMIPPQGDTEIIELGTVTLQAGETHSFSLLATQISDPVPGALNQLFFRVNQISPLPNIFSDSYLWYYEKTGNKAVLYSKEAFKEQKEKILYENPQPETPSPYKLYDQDGNEVGYYIKIQRDAEIEIDSDEPEPDTYTEDDSDYIIVV